jgi:hypothetical protein
MSASIIRHSIERRPNAVAQDYAYRKFEIMSHDGSVTGEVGVPNANDATVMVETKRRLRDLLRDALTDLDRGPLAG